MGLYDPQDFPGTKTGFDVAEVNTDFTLADVLAWARTKPADEAYRYTECGECALAQFLLETGRAHDPIVSPSHWQNGRGGFPHLLPPHVDDAADGSMDGSLNETFGAFADRLEKALS